MRLELFPRAGKKWRNWKSKTELKLYRPQNFWDRTEYWEECRRPKEICCRSDPSERHPVRTDRITDNNQHLCPILLLYTTHEKWQIKIQINVGLRWQIWVSWSAVSLLIASRGKLDDVLPMLTVLGFRTQTKIKAIIHLSYIKGKIRIGNPTKM